MKFLLLLATVLMASAVMQALGQSSGDPQYTPAVPAAPVNVGYGYGDYGGGATPASAAMSGMSSLVRAQGDYNLSTSAAMINVEEARRQNIQNQKSSAEAFFELRKLNREARAAEEEARKPKLTEEQLIRLAQAGKPQRLSPGDCSAVSGTINWPLLLTDDDYRVQREQLDELFAHRAAQGGLERRQYEKAAELTDQMLAILKAQILQVQPGVYISAKQFLQSLAYEARFSTT